MHNQLFLYLVDKHEDILVRLLLDHGADVNLPCGLTDADISSLDGARCIGSGALNEACRIGSVPLIHLFFQKGAVDHENVALATAFNVSICNSSSSITNSLTK